MAATSTLIVGDGCLGVLEAGLGGGEARLKGGVAWAQAQGCGELGHGLFRAVLVQEGLAEVGMDVGVVGGEPCGFGEVRDGLRRPALPDESDGEVAVGFAAGGM